MREAYRSLACKGEPENAFSGSSIRMKGVWSIERRERRANNSIQSAAGDSIEREVIALLDLGS
jgi:hypothetical protein